MNYYMLKVKFPSSLTEDEKHYQPIKYFYGKTKEEAEFKYRQYVMASKKKYFYGKTKEEAEAKYRQHLQASVEEGKPHQTAKEFFGRTKEEALHEYLKASSEKAGKE